jgi:hypothetical protein
VTDDIPTYPTRSNPTEQRLIREWKTVPDHPPAEEIVATVEIPAALETVETEAPQ